jgi:NAD(P)-dependent dehydrogenase (short-subunit alcohol dehydrogenase family)
MAETAAGAPRARGQGRRGHRRVARHRARDRARLRARRRRASCSSSRKQEAVDAVAEEIRRAAARRLAVAAHAARPDDVEAMVARAARTFGGVDVAVANARPIRISGPLLAAEPVALGQDVRAQRQGLRPAGAGGRARHAVWRGGGLDRLRGLDRGLRPWPGLGVYSVSKAAVLHMTRSWRRSSAGENIRVNAIAPGLIETRFSAALYEAPERAPRASSDIPLHRLGAPDEVAGMAIHLAGPASTFTTGGVFRRRRRTVDLAPPRRRRRRAM